MDALKEFIQPADESISFKQTQETKEIENKQQIEEKKVSLLKQNCLERLTVLGQIFSSLKSSVAQIISEIQAGSQNFKKEVGMLLNVFLKEKEDSIFKKIRKLPRNVISSLAALALITEVTTAHALFQTKPEKNPYKIIKAQDHASNLINLRFENKHVIVENDYGGVFIKQNLRRPESLVDVGKILLEPLTFGMKICIDKKYIMPIRVITGSSNEEPFIFEADVPYEYAQNFKKATPIDQQKMEIEMEEKSRVLIEQILPKIVGLSFFKEEVKNIRQSGSVKVTEVRIDGFASGESDCSLDRDNPKNQQLSELRAENAAYVLQKLFKDC